MRIPIPLVVDMTDEQVAEWASLNQLPGAGSHVMAKDVGDDVRSHVLTVLNSGILARFADITIKR